MSLRPKALVSWSTGKDSAYALHEIRRAQDLEIVGLLTTVSSVFARVSMHGVRECLLDQQADALGLPCRKVLIPSPCPNDIYEHKMRQALEQAKREGVTHVIFGDLFLEDIRSYREARLAEIGMKGTFPLWGRETKVLAREMVGSGLRATLTCIDPKRLDPSFAGRVFDGTLLDMLPADIDPCGEKGEFHSFAWSGPMFKQPIQVVCGEVVERDGFVFADVLPGLS
jgi:uncharacterized protein (TIGR00290 family)